MIYAFRLGPIALGDHPLYAYYAFSETEAFPPVPATEDAEGLVRLKLALPAELLCCEPALETVARPLGFLPQPVPAWLRETRAGLAFRGAVGLQLDDVRDQNLVETFLRAACAYWSVAPWRYWADADPIAVTACGASLEISECALLGYGGQESGLALYPRAGDAARMEALVQADQVEEARHFPGLSVVAVPELPWAAEAIRDAFGVPVLPMPIKATSSGPALITEHDLATLTTALAAAALLDPAAREASATQAFGGRTIALAFTAPPPRGG